MNRTVKFLVVDDFEPFRRFVCSALEAKSEFEVVGQAADGLEAIEKAAELQPDVILLDISLPKLDGIAAARRIRDVAPTSIILFLTEHAFPEFVDEALSTGAIGYVVKSDAGIELLAAAESVIQGKRFVSRRLEQSALTGVHDDRVHNKHIHEVQLYSAEAGFLNTLTDFIAANLKIGNAVIVVATESHRNSLFSRLQSRGLNINSAINQGNYISLDVAETLSTFMVDDFPDPDRLFRVAGDLIEKASKVATGKNSRVAACGECAPFLWAQGKAEAAVRLEQLWTQIAKTYDVDILCGYPLRDFHDEARRDMFQRICAEHTAVYS